MLLLRACRAIIVWPLFSEVNSAGVHVADQNEEKKRVVRTQSANQLHVSRYSQPCDM